MCYDAAAAPPVPNAPITRAEAAQATLTSGDGTRIGAFLAHPEKPSGVGVLVLPDNRGLSGFYQQLAVRLAELGHTAVAIDYYARTAGTDYRDRPESFADMATLMPDHLARLTSEGLSADMSAGVERLRESCHAVVSLGFCMGGRFAFNTAAPRFGLDGVIGLYGFPGELNGAPGPIQLAHLMTAPILALWGGGDENIPPAMVTAFDDALTAAGVGHEFVTYPDAPHGFFDHQLPDFADASADAWRRITRFISATAQEAAAK
ncbi:dienelactone hydrolase family protein [Streptosporangium sp. NPDC006013]|uniref:dienelactone hydrolase family protein n=1 Tax=Streptosporangium sp. NPDC006013 TaxID=3155596 RepID=UPI0033A347CA